MWTRDIRTKMTTIQEKAATRIEELERRRKEAETQSKLLLAQASKTLGDMEKATADLQAQLNKAQSGYIRRAEGLRIKSLDANRREEGLRFAIRHVGWKMHYDVALERGHVDNKVEHEVAGVVNHLTDISFDTVKALPPEHN
jgi:hypothetical protein